MKKVKLKEETLVLLRYVTDKFKVKSRAKVLNEAMKCYVLLLEKEEVMKRLDKSNRVSYN
jgi:hypothetical protein